MEFTDLNKRWHEDSLYTCSTNASIMNGGSSKSKNNITISKSKNNIIIEKNSDIKSVMKKNRELKLELNECKEELAKLKLQIKTIISNSK